MLTTDSTDFSIRLAVFSKPDDVHELAILLAEECGLHQDDAIHEAHSVPCVLSPRLTSANADRVATVIKRLGLRAEPVSLEELESVEDLRTVRHVACRSSGLVILDLLGRSTEVIPWVDVEFLSIGELPADVSHHELTGAATLMTSGRRIHDVVSDVPKCTLELWIVCHRPERVYRLDARKLNFESLAERKTNSMQINLHRLLQDIVDRAPHTQLTPAAREFLDHEKTARFTSPEQFRNVTQLYLLMRHRLAHGSHSCFETAGSTR